MYNNFIGLQNINNSEFYVEAGDWTNVKVLRTVNVICLSK